jgi:hypothetical protein
MERYRDIRLEMPGAEALPFWALGSEGDAGTEDLAAWLRDTGGDGPVESFSSEIDASWLGAVPAPDDAEGGGSATPGEPALGGGDPTPSSDEGAAGTGT